jgi:hypothetical protein
MEPIYRKGSIMDSMSEAVEGAELILYGVSERYKDSANVSRAAVGMPCEWQ